MTKKNFTLSFTVKQNIFSLTYFQQLVLGTEIFLYNYSRVFALIKKRRQLNIDPRSPLFTLGMSVSLRIELQTLLLFLKSVPYSVIGGYINPNNALLYFISSQYNVEINSKETTSRLPIIHFSQFFFRKQLCETVMLHIND